MSRATLMNVVLAFAVILLVTLPTAGASQTCGDLNGDGLIHVGDAMDFTTYMTDLTAPQPSAWTMADMDNLPGITPGDLAYLFSFLYEGGPWPCGEPVPAAPVYAGSIALIGVQGLIDENTVASGRQLKFFFQCTNDLEQRIWNLTNGFAVTSDAGPVEASLEVTGRWSSLYPFYGVPETADNLGVHLFSPFSNVLDPLASNGYFTIAVDPIPIEDIGSSLVIDSSTFGHLGHWEWYVDGLTPVIPSWGGPYAYTVGEPGYLAGDVDDNGSVNISDITAMVDYLFRNGPEPPIMEACDANGDCSMPNVADLTYIVDYLFKQGDSPQYSCSMVEKAAPGGVEITVGSDYSAGRTVVSISSPIDLSGLQLEVTGTVGASAASLLDPGVELFQGEADGVLRIGLLDIEGSRMIASGKQQIVEIPGECTVVSVLAADTDHRLLRATVTTEAISIPGAYTLHQNYPNPFNPSTVISFSLPGTEQARLEIYNITGRKIATLVDDRLEAGTHSFEFDAGDIASGIYVYRLTAGEYSATRKMLLLR